MNWVDIVVGVSSGLGTGGGVAGAIIKYGKQAMKVLAKDIAEQASNTANEPLKADLDVVKHDINNIRLSLATQFGGNGGGMREAINRLQVDMAEMKGHLSATSVPTVVSAHSS